MYVSDYMLVYTHEYQFIHVVTGSCEQHNMVLKTT